MTLGERLQEGFFKNPIAWVLFAAFLLAEWGNWQRGSELDTVCQLTGPHIMSVPNPRTAGERIDSICVGRTPD